MANVLVHKKFYLSEKKIAYTFQCLNKFFFQKQYETRYILNKSENATLQLSIFCEKVLDTKYLLKLNNVSQTSSQRFVETPPICHV